MFGSTLVHVLKLTERVDEDPPNPTDVAWALTMFGMIQSKLNKIANFLNITTYLLS